MISSIYTELPEPLLNDLKLFLRQNPNMGQDDAIALALSQFLTKQNQAIRKVA
jgi:hypothetical protein